MSAETIRNHLRNGEPELARVGALGALATCEEGDRGELYALLSRALLRLGRPRQAMAYAEEAAGRFEHWEASLALAEALVGLGQPLPARAILAEALKRVRASDGPTFDAEIWLGSALAEACRAGGDPRTGIDVARRAVGCAERHHGLHAPETAEALHELGVCLHGAGEPDDARRVLERCLAVRKEQCFGTADYAATLDGLGVVLRKLRKPQQAVELHCEALRLWHANLGKRSSPEGACRHSLAQALHNTGDFHGAREEMEEAWQITAGTLGPDHVDTSITAFELGRFELDCGDVMEGIGRMTAARQIVADHLGATHPVVQAMDRWL